MHSVTILASLLLAAMSGPLAAVEVYRCASADGVSFQDRPCAAGQTQTLLQTPDDPPLPPPITAPPTPADTPPAPAVAVVPPPPRQPAPDFFLCTRPDGNRYLSEDGIGARSAVPAGVLSGSGQSLAEAYGGKNGIGVSAPGLRPIPHIPASQSPFGGAYVWVYDECHHADPAEACAYLRNQLDTIEGKLRRAFSDTEAQLKQEQINLRERLHGC